MLTSQQNFGGILMVFRWYENIHKDSDGILTSRFDPSNILEGSSREGHLTSRKPIRIHPRTCAAIDSCRAFDWLNVPAARPAGESENQTGRPVNHP